MKSNSNWRRIVAVALTFCGIALAQGEQQKRTLVINGQSGEASIVQINGRSYIDLETLARIGNGTLTFRGDQIVLTLPGLAANDQAAAPADNQLAEPGMSGGFMRAAIQSLATIKQWQNILAYAIQRGIPGDGSQLVFTHDRAAEALRLATVAASTDSDQDAMQLLSNHFNNLDAWNNQLVAARKAMDTANYSMSPGALNDSPQYQKIARCSQFLGEMLASSKFEDDASCH